MDYTGNVFVKHRSVSDRSLPLLPHRQVLGGKKQLRICFKTKAFIAKNALDMKNNQISHGSSVQDDV